MYEAGLREAVNLKEQPDLALKREEMEAIAKSYYLHLPQVEADIYGAHGILHLSLRRHVLSSPPIPPLLLNFSLTRRLRGTVLLPLSHCHSTSFTVVRPRLFDC